ncbi:hypothetical protein AWJ20_1195 [Sugiyamaella lignohabitans]|uniref:RIC1 C-terminal alpha solenoid region domain-containing protein n=1 Tax=Sugiyamaella lignohabitans TaxID=796027 RepID=A0A161HJL3_9ASCO|nr:uncharacterized protein AWJ20_1195 [Sugiyamaella lignohabitans]ANB12917.1 hypothetical protein AWJ20_1195 [Sugiyamaella lignohabitans]
MLWPSSTPDRIVLPSLDGKKIANSLKDDNEIIDLALHDASYMLVVLTKRAIYVYRLKPLCPVLVYARSEHSIKTYGENVQVVIRPDGKMIGVWTSDSASKNDILLFEVGDGIGSASASGVDEEDDGSSLYSLGASSSGPAEVCRFVRADHFVSYDTLGSLPELRQIKSSDSADQGFQQQQQQQQPSNAQVRRISDAVRNGQISGSGPVSAGAGGGPKSRKNSVASSIGDKSLSSAGGANDTGFYNSYSRRQSFSESLIQTYPGPGEALGVREMRIRFCGVIKDHVRTSDADDTAANGHRSESGGSGVDKELQTDSDKANGGESEKAQVENSPAGPHFTSIIPLEEYIMVSTTEVTKFFKWHNEKITSEPVYTIVHSELEWLDSDRNDKESGKELASQSGYKKIVHISRSKAMSLFSITTQLGSVYSATLTEFNKGSTNKSKPASMVFKGYILHSSSPPSDGPTLPPAISSSINARFSEIAVACSNGSIYLYNIRDYSGTSKLLNKMDSPSFSSSGSPRCLSWSSDGCTLLAGYEHGWILYSVYGMTNASSFLIKNDQKTKETWLGGIKKVCWTFSGDSAFILSSEGSRQEFWCQGFLKWGAVGTWTHDNLKRPVLLKESNKILIYRGQEQSDLTTIDRDALLWLTVTIPGNYMAENWPIRYVSSSADGRYIAVAGVRGLAHYSLYSGRWKLFTEEYMDKEISVRAGMIWYGHFLIVAVDTDQYKYEIKIYSRELELSSYYVVTSEEIGAPILKMCVIQNLLVVYAHDNNVYFYRITSISGNDIRSLDLEHKISLNGLVHSPARVRCIEGLLADNQDPTIPITADNLKLVFLVDGMLTIFEPASGPPITSYKKHLLHHSIEYYFITPPGKDNSYHCMLWAFDGTNMLVWIKDYNSQFSSIKPAVVPVESYPIAVLMDKGILTGIETDTLPSRENYFTYFKFWTSTQLFVPFILESVLKMGNYEKAVTIANEYKHLKYFSHILEMLLYQILISEGAEADPDSLTPASAQGQTEGDASPTSDSQSDISENSLLVKAADLVFQFPQMLDIFLGCTRKTEVKYWKRLFKVIGSPQQLFERCVLLGKLKTAAGYLLILHSLSKGTDDARDNTVQLFKLAYESGDWDLCKELTRFLTAVDRKYSGWETCLRRLGLRPRPRCSSRCARVGRGGWHY